MGLSRGELFRKVGIVKDGPDLDVWTNRAFLAYEKRNWEVDYEGSPHGNPWHTSFHASAYPGGERACARRELYTLMDIPPPGPTGRRLRGQGEVGKAIEHMIVYRWGRLGITIGGSVPLLATGKIVQVGFEAPGLWLTGSSDAVLDLRPEWPAVLPVDVKSKAADVIEQMKMGQRSYDPAHYMQLQAYLFLCILFHKDMGWDAMGLQPAKGGKIYYVSRDDPSITHEFYVEADGMLMAEANGRLGAWKEAFKDDLLPARPKDWKWSEEPCKWCKFKKFACKPDALAGVTKLSETNGVDFAKTIRLGYDPNKVREAVLKRWSSTTQ